MKYSIVLFVLLFSILSLSAQETVTRCHHDELHKHYYENDSDYRHDYDVRNVLMEQIREQTRNSNSRLSCENPIIIPVAVHYQGIVSQSTACLEELALSAIDALNKDYAATNPDFSDYFDPVANSALTIEQAATGGTCIQFCLADLQHPSGFGLNDGDYAVTVNQDYIQTIPGGGYENWPNFTQGAWSGYLNFFVTDLAGGLLGFSPPGGQFNGSGVVVDRCYFGGEGFGCGGGIGNGGPCSNASQTTFGLNRTLTHEVGHYLTLRHPWGPINLPSNASDPQPTCQMDDGHTDTPATDWAHSGCPVIGPSSTSCGSQDMYMNFMDYAADECSYMFSEQQAQAMYTYADLFMSTSSSKCSPSLTEYNNAANDASIFQIITPSNFACGSSVAPRVSLRSIGTDELTSVDIVYSASNGGGSNTFSWTGQLEQGDIEDVVLPSINIPSVDFTLNVTVSMPNGVADENPSNDSQTESLVISDGANLPFYEDVESFSVPFPAQGITIVDPDGDDYVWDRRPGASAYGNGVYSAYFNNFQVINGIGKEDWFILPEMNATGFNSVILDYDYAYNYSPDGVDSLAIYYSLGCTGNWEQRWVSGGAALATAATPSSTLYIPNANTDWVNTSIGINTDGFDFIRIAFVNISGEGNNLYLDNIGVTGSATIVSNTDIEELETFNVSPNPSRGTLNVQLGFAASVDYTIRIYDMVGKEINTRNGSNSVANETFDMTSLANGIYFVSVQSGDKVVTEKVILAK